MRTREERRRLRRLALIASTALLVLWAAMLLCICADAACEIEGLRTDQAVTGAAVWAWALMKIALWLDKPRRTK